MATRIDDPALLWAIPELVKRVQSLDDRVRHLEGAAGPKAGPGAETARPPAPSPRPRTAQPKTKQNKGRRQEKGKHAKARKNTKEETSKNVSNEDQGGKRRRRKKAFRKLTWRAMPAAVLYSVALGQDLRKGGRSPFGRSLEGGQRAAAAVRERLRRAFRTAEGTGADRGGAASGTSTVVSGHQRRAEEICPFCPDGLAVDRLTVTAGGFPCAFYAAVSSMMTTNNRLCRENDYAEETCCPALAEDLSADLPTAPPTSLDQQCPEADKKTCGCEIVGQGDYRGIINVPESGDAQCRPWDSDVVTKYFGLDLWPGATLPLFLSNSDLRENYCRSVEGGNVRPGCVAQFPFGEPSFAFCDVPKCDPCSCVPACGLPNLAPCGCPSAHHAAECCDDIADPASCRCGFLREACRKSLENGHTEFCSNAEEACCTGHENPWCTCDVYQQMCAENPFEFTCNLAAESCCIKGFGVDSYIPTRDVICKCDFYTYVADDLGHNTMESSAMNSEMQQTCDEAQKYHTQSFDLRIGENCNSLQWIWLNTEGEFWNNNTGWKEYFERSVGCSDTQYTGYCDWYGISCNDRNSITEINLRKNNLKGVVIWDQGIDFPDLVKLDISQNKLSGQVETNELQSFNRKLEYLNISSNEFSGHADVLLHPSLKYVDFSNNKFTTAGFRRFHRSYHALRELDLRSNNIAQTASEIFVNIPPTLESLDLSNNNIEGTLPAQFPIEQLRFLRMANNRLSGPLPEFPDHSPKLEHLVLENNDLTGTILDSFWKLGDMSVLNLAINKLHGDVPDSIGDVTQLRNLRLSSNSLDGTIPEKVGRLKDVSEIFDLSSNDFTGSIPSVLGSFRGEVRLSGNAKLSSSGLAPLNLCLLEGFDRQNDNRLCPAERNALHDIFEDAKGSEWTESHNWLDQYIPHCLWYGVKCSDGSVIEVNLTSNGLSGKLSNEIVKLPNLSVLDVSENDIKGPIPRTIGSLTNLRKLRLCYNSFVGLVPDELKQLLHLEMIQVQGNKLNGTIPSPANMHLLQELSSFVSDCGYPSFYRDSLVCEGCTMCCNSLLNCHKNEDTVIQKIGFNNYMQLSWMFFLFVAGCLFVSFLARKSVGNALGPDELTKVKKREQEYALDLIGRDSVYKLILGNSLAGWCIAVVTLASQLLLCYVFVLASEFKYDASTDLQYSWKCPPNDDQCRDTLGRTPIGWFLLAVLLIAHLLKDVIKGIKLVLLSSKRMRLSFFVGGLVLIFVAGYTAYASTVYNLAIATNDPSLIANAVIILFVTDIDELMYEIKLEIESDWAPRLELDDRKQAEEEQNQEKYNKEKEDEEKQDKEAQDGEAQDNVEHDGEWQNEEHNQRRSSLLLDLGEEEENRRRASLMFSMGEEEENRQPSSLLLNLGEEEENRRRASLMFSMGEEEENKRSSSLLLRLREEEENRRRSSLMSNMGGEKENKRRKRRSSLVTFLGS